MEAFVQRFRARTGLARAQSRKTVARRQRPQRLPGALQKPSQSAMHSELPILRHFPPDISYIQRTPLFTDNAILIFCFNGVSAKSVSQMTLYRALPRAAAWSNYLGCIDPGLFQHLFQRRLPDILSLLKEELVQ